jgi:hypothetical protein
MNKHILALLAIVIVAAGIFQMRKANAKCKGGSCGKRTVKTVKVCTGGRCK